MPETHRASPETTDEIDLRDLFLALWEKRRLILATSLATLVLAFVYAYLIAKPSYESSALLLPTQAPSADQLGAAAALLGKKASGSADVDLYQSLLTSRTVIHKLLATRIPNRSDTAQGRLEPLHAILQLDTGKLGEFDHAADYLARSIAVGSRESGEGGILEIKFTASSPWLAQEIGDEVLKIGQEELRLVRIERSNVILSRLNVAVAEAKSEWESAARVLTSYRQANRSISLPNQMMDLAGLEMEKSAKEQKYLLVRKEYELQMMERVKAAPPMMILDPANLPSRKSKPRRMLILALGLVVGLAGSATFVLTWKALAK